MRRFNYLQDGSIIYSSVKNYLAAFKADLEWLVNHENNIEYVNALNQLNEFLDKYPDLYKVSSIINEDLLKPENVEYCFRNRRYPFDASKIGMQFQADLEKIFQLEEKLKNISLEIWKRDLTSFDKIENGESFMAVGHASILLPGVYGNNNYRNGRLAKQYLSCSLLSDKELNTFNGYKIVYITQINDENYICSASWDSVTRESSIPDFFTVGEVIINDEPHYISAGFSGSGKVNTKISTPKKIEEESVAREINQTGEMYNYDVLTNEIVLDRTKTQIIGALLISNGCDLLLREYLFLKKNNIPFKCINKGIYREKHGLVSYTEEEYERFINLLNHEVLSDNYSSEDLLGYYNEVVLKMSYSVEIVNMIKDIFSEFVDLGVNREN